MPSNPKSFLDSFPEVARPIPILPALHPHAVHPQHPLNPTHFHGDRDNSFNCSSHWVGKKYSKAQPRFSGPGVCLLAGVGLFGKTCPPPSAVLERLLNIFVEEMAFGRWRLANKLWACLKAKSLTPGLLQVEWKLGTKFVREALRPAVESGDAERTP